MHLTEWGGSNRESETGFPRVGHGCSCDCIWGSQTTGLNYLGKERWSTQASK